MIMITLVRSYGVMHIHRFPVSGLYGFEVTSSGVSDNHAWPETFSTLREAIAFAKSHGWKEVE